MWSQPYSYSPPVGNYSQPAPNTNYTPMPSSSYINSIKRNPKRAGGAATYLAIALFAIIAAFVIYKFLTSECSVLCAETGKIDGLGNKKPDKCECECIHPYVWRNTALRNSNTEHKCRKCELPMVWDDNQGKCVCGINKDDCEKTFIDRQCIRENTDKTDQQVKELCTRKRGEFDEKTCKCRCLHDFGSKECTANTLECGQTCTTDDLKRKFGRVHLPCLTCEKCNIKCQNYGKVNDIKDAEGRHQYCECLCEGAYKGRYCQTGEKDCYQLNNERCGGGKNGYFDDKNCKCICNGNWITSGEDQKDLRGCRTCPLETMKKKCDKEGKDVNNITCECKPRYEKIDDVIEQQTIKTPDSITEIQFIKEIQIKGKCEDLTTKETCGYDTRYCRWDDSKKKCIDHCGSINQFDRCDQEQWCSWVQGNCQQHRPDDIIGTHCTSKHGSNKDSCCQDNECDWCNGKCYPLMDNNPCDDAFSHNYSFKLTGDTCPDSNIF